MMSMILTLLVSFTVHGQTMAMIDTGLDLNEVNSNLVFTQEYLKCKYSMNAELMSKCEKRDFDIDKHGTQVFNVLSKNMPNNSILVYAYASPDHSLKMLNSLVFPSSLKQVYIKRKILEAISINIAQAINLATLNHASVVNISLIDRGFETEELKKAISYNPDTLFVFAAGNSGKNLDDISNKMYPCSFKFPNTLCVGALDEKGHIAEYSNYGEDVDLYVKPQGEEGTSFSAPVIANKAYSLRKKFTMAETVVKLKQMYSLKKGK